MLNKFLAQISTPLDLGPFRGLGPLGGENNPLTTKEAAVSTFTKFISTVIGVMTIIAFIWFIFQLFIGAIAWLGSGGDKAKLQEAQKKITTAFIGLIIVISAIFLIKIFSVIFGIDFLNLTNLINTL